MEGIANFISMLDYVLDTKRKRHITGGLLLSGALLFGGLASITEYTQRLQEAGYKDYSRTIDEKPSGTPGEVPYVISPDEFGELEDYTKVSLTYFADGVLADECGEIVDDVEEIINDGLDHFGEYEDDSVFVRSDAKRCDYEILKDLRDFSDFKKKNFPPNNDEEV